MKKLFLFVAISIMSLTASAQNTTEKTDKPAQITDNVSSQKVIKMSNNPTATKVPSLLGNICFNQNAPYNLLCPTMNGNHCFTGCTITALTQIMRYYKYPDKPTIPADQPGLIEYTTDKGQIQVSWDLSKTTFDWNNILESYHKTDNANDTQKKAVATLMAAVGAAFRAAYSEKGAGAIAKNNAMIKYFGYDKDAYIIRYTVCTLERKCLELKNAIDAGQIAVIGSAEGHCFIIDGYDMTGEHPKFHVNWGWGGAEDGFFDLTDMRPSEVGGCNHTNYGELYNIYLNIFPENNADDGIMLSAKSVTVDKALASAGGQVRVTVTTIGNESKVRIAKGAEYYYLVDTNSNKCYKTDAFVTMPNLMPCKNEKEGPFVDSFTNTIKIPATVPAGKYYVELRRNGKDHFITNSPATITIK